MDNILDHVVVQGQKYDIVSPTAFGDYIETIGSACINPDGYAQGSTFLARLGNEQYYYEATAAITQGAAINEGTNCKKTTVTGRESELASDIQTLSNYVIETGVKNELVLDAGYIKGNNSQGSWTGDVFTHNGITFTLQYDDGVVTGVKLGGTFVSGYSTARILLVGGINIDSAILSGGLSNNIYLQVVDNAEATELATNKGGDSTVSNLSNVKIRLIVKENPSAQVVKPMLRNSMINNNTWEQGAKTNVQLTQDTTGLIDVAEQNGAKNLLPNNGTSQVINGVTFTVNSDGTIKANGTATAELAFKITGNDTIGIEKGRYHVSGCPTGGSSSTYGLYFGLYNGSTWVGNPFEYGNGYDLNIGTDWSTVNQLSAGINIKSGVTVSNLVFKPMITLADQPNSDYAHYVPYAKTNRELTDNVNKLNAYVTLSSTDTAVDTDGKYTLVIPSDEYVKYRDLVVRGYNGSNTGGNRFIFVMPTEVGAGDTDMPFAVASIMGKVTCNFGGVANTLSIVFKDGTNAKITTIHVIKVVGRG